MSSITAPHSSVSSTRSRRTFPWIEWGSVTASMVLLAGAAIDGTHFRSPPDAREYQARVKVAAEELPLSFANWTGEDKPPDASAVKLLHPNVMLSRRYVNPLTGVSAGFLFVDCQDARDTVGHYPPICYPSQGWSLQTTTLHDWTLPHTIVHGTEYLFVRGVFDGNGSEIVDNFFVLPGTGIEPNRDEVIKAASDLQRRFYGVAQIQLVFSAETTESQRDEAFSELIGPMEGLMETVETIKAPPSAANSVSWGKGSGQSRKAIALVRGLEDMPICFRANQAQGELQ